MFATVARLCRRGRWVGEIALLGSIYVVYEVIRANTGSGMSQSLANGRWLLHLERVTHLDPEHGLNNVFARVPELAIPSCYFYAVCHYVVTPIVLIWLWRAHHSYYRSTRSVLIVGTLIGLLGFWAMPTAPPRLLGGGYVDTMEQWARVGWWDGAASAPRGLEGLTDQFGAMPSLHVGWAVWCGWAIARHARHRSVRVLGALYPVMTTVVVMGTANHYLADAVAGLGVMAVAYLLVAAAHYVWARFVSAELISATRSHRAGMRAPAELPDSATAPGSSGQLAHSSRHTDERRDAPS